MKVTNKHNLAEPLYNAVKNVYPPKPNRLSVTRLIDSPLIASLLIEHWEGLQEDVIDRLWALLGNALDHILTKNAPSYWITQDKIEHPIDGITLVGKLDYYDPQTQILGDWKSTSCWSYVFGGKADWEKQLNCYDYLNRVVRGRVSKKLVAQRLFRDWMQRKANDKGYPDLPFMEIEIPQWPPEQQEQYIKDQIEYHTMSKQVECSPEQKWEKPTTYRVEKTGRKSALRVLDELAVAKTWCIDNGYGIFDKETKGAIKLKAGISITERKGECTRCLNYCPVRSKCPFMEKQNA